MFMASVLQRILISMTSTNNNFYDFYNLYGNAKNMVYYNSALSALSVPLMKQSVK